MVRKIHVNVKLAISLSSSGENSPPKHRSKPTGLLWSIAWVSMASLLPLGMGALAGTGLNPGFPMGTCSRGRELGMSQAKTSDRDLGKHLGEGAGKVLAGTTRGVLGLPQAAPSREDQQVLWGVVGGKAGGM